MPRLWDTAAEALAGVVKDGAIIAVGGFGLSGNPTDLIEALRATGASNLTIVSNNMGVDGKGLGLLLENSQVSKVIASYVGENKLFAEQYLQGKLEVEFVPQGTLAERLRAGGAGIAGFYTKTGVGTIVAEGKPTEVFDGEEYVLERGIVADIALVHAHTADTAGNLIYRHTARNFNPVIATAGRLTIAEAEHVLHDGFVDPNIVVTPGIFVQRLVQTVPRVKDIEQRTVRPRSADSTPTTSANDAAPLTKGA
jgi:3-oxoacid CoA-transferase subunit A